MKVSEIREPVLALLPPIFRLCCDDEDGLYSLSTPFLWGDRVCACDGRIIVKGPIPKGVAEILGQVTEERRLPRPEAVFDGLVHAPDPTALPGVPKPVACRECRGSGTSECDRCGQDRECPDCDGTGSYWDPECRVVLAPGVSIGPRYAHILKSQGARIYLPDPALGKAIKFVVGEADGLLMPLKP